MITNVCFHPECWKVASIVLSGSIKTPRATVVLGVFFIWCIFTLLVTRK